MENYISCTAVAVMAALIFSEARRNGNIPSSACKDMIPGHGGVAQTDFSSYEIRTISYLFVPGKTLEVTLNRQSTPPLRGFYCQAKDLYSNLTVGQFDEVDDMPDARGHSCSSSADIYDTISHSLQWSENTANVETHISLKWKTSDELLEMIKFRCTFVQSYSVYWVNEESRVITSITTVSAEDCCVIDKVPIGCSPLCRHVSEEPDNLDLARNTLESVWNNDAACGFFHALVSIRCSYWSQYPSPDYSSGFSGFTEIDASSNDEPTDSPEAFVNDELEECCVARNISQECMIFCDVYHYAELTIDEDDFGRCLEENTDLSLCIIYPTAARDDHSSTSYATSSPSTTASTTTTTQRATSFSASPSSPATNPFPRTTSFVTSVETTSSTTLSTTASPTTTTQRATSFATSTLSPSNSRPKTTSFVNSVGSTPFQLLADGVVIYVITTTVNVEDAIQNSSLKQSVFEGLKKGILTPSLATLAGYIDVQVGVEVYEGSLVVLSEGRFIQQADGSVPTLQNMENALQKRLSEVGGQISHAGAVWPITQPIAVRRRATNGLCVDKSCESNQTCVEVGSEDFVCFCHGLNNEEQICAEENPTETTAVVSYSLTSSPTTSTSSRESNVDLPPGAIAGIAVGVVMLIIVVILLSILVYRRTKFCHNSDKPDNLKKIRHTSTTYVYPNNAVENNEENIYSSITCAIGDEPPALPPNNLPPTLPSNSVTYDRVASHRGQTKHSISEEQYTNYMEPITSTDNNPAGVPEKSELTDENLKLDQIDKKDGKISPDYSTVDGYELATDDFFSDENDSHEIDKVSSSELQANGYITFDKE